MKTIRRVLLAIRNPEARQQPGLAKAIQIARAFDARLELFHTMNDPLFDELARLEDDTRGQAARAGRRRSAHSSGAHVRKGAQARRAGGLLGGVGLSTPRSHRASGHGDRRGPHHRRMPQGCAHPPLADSSHGLGTAAHQPAARAAAQERQAVPSAAHTRGRGSCPRSCQAARGSTPASSRPPGSSARRCAARCTWCTPTIRRIVGPAGREIRRRPEVERRSATRSSRSRSARHSRPFGRRCR